MHICFFAQDHSIEAGANQSMLSLITKLMEDGNRVSVILTRRGSLENQFKKLDVSYYICYTPSVTIEVDNTRKKTLVYLIKILVILINTFFLSLKLRSEKINLIHINKAVGIAGVYLANRLHVHYIWHLREFMEEDYRRKFQYPNHVYKLMNNSSDIIAISQSIKNKYQKYIKNNIKVIYNGIETKSIEYCKNKFQSKSIKILMAGTITEGKRQLDAIKAVKLLREKYDIKLIIIGKVLSADYYNLLLEYIIDNDLSSLIEFKEFTNNLNVERKQCDIGLLCSEKEAFGRVTIETMLSGMLFVGSNSGGTKELVENNVNGLLYKMGDVLSLVQTIDYALNNKDKMHTIIQNAYEYAMNNYSIEKTYENINKVYQGVLKNGFND